MEVQRTDGDQHTTRTQRQEQPVEYVVPEQTILIENPVAITEDANGAAKGFLDFDYSGGVMAFRFFGSAKYAHTFSSGAGMNCSRCK